MTTTAATKLRHMRAVAGLKWPEGDISTAISDVLSPAF
jgi:hypothetical protein